MAFYRLRKWITHHKWQQNTHKCIQGSLSGTERCDSCRLSSYRYSLAVVYDLRPPSLSCTLHPLSHSRPQRVGDLEYALPQTAPLPTARRAVSSLASQATFLFTTLSGLPNLWAPLRKKKLSEIDRRLPSAAVLSTVKSSLAQQPHQSVQSDALLCLFHSLEPAIIFGLKKVTP